VRGESSAVLKKGEKSATARKEKDDLGRGKGGAALLSPLLGSLLPSRFTPFLASPTTTEPSPRLKLGKQ